MAVVSSQALFAAYSKIYWLKIFKYAYGHLLHTINMHMHTRVHIHTVLVWVALVHLSPLTMFWNRWKKREWWVLPGQSASYDNRGQQWLRMW